jgi:hypothetical protein
MAVRCIRVKLKRNSQKQVKNWFSELNSRKDEVLESLKNEGIIVESAFLDKINNSDYLIYYIKAESIKNALKIFQESSLPIDQFYKDQWKQFCEEILVLDPLLDVDLLS